MAEVVIKEDTIHLHLTFGEKILGVHREPNAKLNQITSVEILEDAHTPVDMGFKVGERLPGVVEVGSIHTADEKLFAAVHQNTPRGLKISFSAGPYDAWVIGCKDPEGVYQKIQNVLSHDG
ncbi:MAG: hypothetical protein M1374_00555 [Firmicutes bacterium]|jgi:hypothetical protein|nr:hypothetical protein [Bacillota bacterium]